MDARRRTRAPYRGWVEISFGSRRVRAAGCDLSVDGIGIAVDGAPPVDAALVSEFALPGIALPVALAGRVVWSDPRAGRAGVRFHAVDPGLADLLANFVQGRL